MKIKSTLHRTLNAAAAVCLRVIVASIVIQSNSVEAKEIAEGVEFLRGPVNQVRIRRAGKELYVYRYTGKDAASVLLSHTRRDVIYWLREAPRAKLWVPASEAKQLTRAGEFWSEFRTKRFHDYAQQTTKLPINPRAVQRTLESGENFAWHDIRFRILGTPGYTPGSVSYVADIADKRLVFCGDLIFGDGKLFDLYSLQDAIPEANIRGYHGFAGRLAAVMKSLDLITQQNPDVLVPLRGPLITNPRRAINTLKQRIAKLYRNYMSTNALHWYFKKDRMKTCVERILGKGARFQLMPYSHYQKSPDWVIENGTTRILTSESGNAFMLDCGNQRVLDAVGRLKKTAVIDKVEGIFVTHYHDDHTDYVAAAAKEFRCPVFAMREYAQVLRNPAGYHLPAMTKNPIANIKSLKNGTTIKWHEFQLTFFFFPGQTYYHGALLVRKGKERPILFVGDAFTPSGMDDYCLLNRNLIGDHTGYLLCLKRIREIGQPLWLVNEHVPYVFSYTTKELDYLEAQYRKRQALVRSISPWDGANYAIDEQWAQFYPYGQTTTTNKPVSLQLRITNHSPVDRSYKLRIKSSWGSLLATKHIKIAAGKIGTVTMDKITPKKPGTHLVTADIQTDGIDVRDWVEAMIEVK